MAKPMIIKSEFIAFVALATVTVLVQLGDCGTINVANNCPHTVWVGTNGQREQNGHKFSDPAQGGFELRRGAKRSLNVETSWSGRVWGRTTCKFSNGQGPCETGRCGDRLQCNGISGEKPATLAEITFDQRVEGQLMDFYDVSLVDGYNLRMRLKPRGGNDCKEGSCTHDMTKDCPGELQMKNARGQVVGCDSKNGVQSFRDYAKRVCPNAYGYWNDDTKTYACRTQNPGQSVFDITFC